MSGTIKSTEMRAAAILTDTYVASDGVNLSQQDSQVNFYIDTTLGSLTSLQVQVEFSDDGTDWYTETSSAISGGVDTMSALERSYAADGKYRLSVPVKDRWIRIKAKGTGDATGSECAIKMIFGLL